MLIERKGTLQTQALYVFVCSLSLFTLFSWFSLFSVFSVFSGGCSSTPTEKDEIQIAVAANFALAIKDIAELFERESGHVVHLSFASSGKHFAQIQHGAPFDVFLSADEEKPLALERAGLTVPGSRFTYAIGQLALWSHHDNSSHKNSTHKNSCDLKQALLHSFDGGRLAVANRALSPYGLATAKVLERLNLMERFKTRFVYGENISQVYQFVHTRNAEFGFVAYSQVYSQIRANKTLQPDTNPDSVWIVPPEMHPPILQQAVLLAHGRNKPAALAFLKYLQTPIIKELIQSYGYKIKENV